MKSLQYIILSLALAAPLLAAGSIQAVIDDNQQEPEPGQARITSAEEDETTRRAQLLERLERRKAERQLQLSFATQQRLKTTCQPAQGKIGSIQVRVQGLETSRRQVHTSLISRLERVAERLAAAGIDTKAFNGQVDEIKAKITAFEAALAEHKQVISDLVEMSCQEDPVAFMASLETARISRQQVKQAAEAIKVYLQQTIKPTLIEFKSQADNRAATGKEE